jgi:hypothetical protein
MGKRIPAGFERRKIQIVRTPYIGDPYWTTIDALVFGHIAVNEDADGKWILTAVKTGCALPRTFETRGDAIRAARAVNGCIDWSRVAVSKAFRLRGWSNKKREVVAAMLRSFRHSAPRTSAPVFESRA